MRKNHVGPLGRLMQVVAGGVGALALGLAIPALAQEEAEQQAQQAEQDAEQAEQQAQQAEQQTQQAEEQQTQQAEEQAQQGEQQAQQAEQQAQQQEQQAQQPQQQQQQPAQQQQPQAQQQQQQPQQGQQAQGGQQGLQAPQLAQPGQAQLGESNQQFGGSQMQQSPQRHTYSMGTIQGTVNGLDFNRGVISISSSGGNVQLRARPMDIVNLNPGDVVALNFANYQGALWIVPDQAGSVQTQNFAQYGTLTGTVDQVNKALGTITVRGQTLRAHPEQLGAIIPGQFVSLGYANVSGTNWLAAVQGAGQSGGM